MLYSRNTQHIPLIIWEWLSLIGNRLHYWNQNSTFKLNIVSNKECWLVYCWHQANVHVEVADCWQLVVPDLISVCSTKYLSQVLFHVKKQSTAVKLWRTFLEQVCYKCTRNVPENWEKFRHVKPTETNSRQRSRISRVNFNLMQVTMQSTFVTSNESTFGRF